MRYALVLAAVVGLLAFSSAEAKQYDDPIAVMTSPQQDSGTRLKAARQAEERFPSDERRFVALNSMIWDRGFGTSERKYAIDQLIKYDEADFKRKLSRRIVLIENAEVLEYIFKLMMDRKWTDMTPTIVRQYARPARGVVEKDRIERAALETLNPGKTIEQVVFDVFCTADEQVEMSQRVAAWELLCRLTPRDQLLALLAKAPDSTAMVNDLRACAADLATVPTNKEGVLWLSYLRDPSRRAWWASAQARVATLTDDKRAGLELRHILVLMNAPDRAAAKDRATLIADLRTRLAAQEHYLLAPTYDGQAKDYPQQFGEVAAQLSWGDALVITTLLDAIQEPSVAATLLAQSERDKTDTGSEHGGALLFNDAGRLYAKEFPAKIRQHNLKFISPPELIEAVYTGAAHYHLHAQETRNRDHAGPGRGDLEFATRLNFNCLVFTSIDKNTLNADYYQPGGIVVDLGVIKR